MRRNIFLYLFIFSLLINIFTYVYFTKQNKFDTGRVQTLEQKVTKLKDSLSLVGNDYFSLPNNNNSVEYFAGQDVNAIAIKVRDGIYAQNVKENGNPLVKYPAIGGNKFMINKIKVLNSRWVIADFSGGTTAGEVLIQYFVDDAGNVSYETLQTFIYPNTVGQ